MTNTIEVNLRGTGVRTTAMTLRAIGNHCAPGERSLSDQLRVYDEVNGSFAGPFIFEPEARECSRWFLGLRKMDIFGNGRMELVGSFTGAPGIRVPVVVYWSDWLKQYRVKPLITRPPLELMRPRHSETTERELYTRPLMLGGADMEASYGVTEFSIVPGGNESPAYLVGVYRISRGEPWTARHETYQRTIWALGQNDTRIETSWCRVLPDLRSVKTTLNAPVKSLVAPLKRDVARFSSGCERDFLE